MTFAWLPMPLRDGAINSGNGFSPLGTGKVSAWLRLAASTISSGEYDAVVDVLNSNPTNQADADRKPAAATAANGLPVMTFDGSDVLVWPITAQNYITTKLGYWLWYKPATVAGQQTLLKPPLSGANVNLYGSGSQIQVEIYMTPGSTGRFANCAALSLTAGAWHSIYMQYDSSRGGDANVVFYVNGVLKAMTYGNLGAGEALGVLPSASGSMTIGGGSNSDTPSAPIANGGQIGPNLYVFNDNLTASEIAALHDFERPT